MVVALPSATDEGLATIGTSSSPHAFVFAEALLFRSSFRPPVVTDLLAATVLALLDFVSEGRRPVGIRAPSSGRLSLISLWARRDSLRPTRVLMLRPFRRAATFKARWTSGF